MMGLYDQTPPRQTEKEGQIGKLLPLYLGWYCMSGSIPPSVFFPFPASLQYTAMQFSSISDYRLLVVISAWYLAIRQRCHQCHSDLSERSISVAANLHVCISLSLFVKANMDCQDSE